MSEATEKLRASVREQQKKTDALILNTKGIQKELRAALSSTDAALKEGEALRKKLKQQAPEPTEDGISQRDKEKIAKLLVFIEKQAGPKPETESLIESIEHDEIIESISKAAKKTGNKKEAGSSPHAPNPSQKKGHIAL